METDVLNKSRFTGEMPSTDGQITLGLSGEPWPWEPSEELLLSGCEASEGILKLYKVDRKREEKL